MNIPIKIGLSACLFDIKCRYNAQASKDDFVIGQLSKHAELKTYCPEAIFGVPREPIRLVENNNNMQVITINTKQNLTSELVANSENLATKAQSDNLSGFILKSKSPSCGMEKVKVYYNDTRCEKIKTGIFASKIMQKYPFLPIEEEGRLKDNWLKENFISSVFAYNDILNFLASQPTQADLVEFHTNYKYFIYAKSHSAYKQLGVIVANPIKTNITTITSDYSTLFMQTLRAKTTINNTYNVLLHLMGYFKKLLNPEEKQNLLGLINNFKQKIVPLITVVKVMQLYINKFEIEYLARQKFFDIYPDELALRSHLDAYK
jgi:uncharacterized protein YbgA (DUF1722 family)/uncharacterized protein YbbK (DUF523 family)